jgi:signal transduction histidine kinase/DNA-binding response OmpR family regulator
MVPNQDAIQEQLDRLTASSQLVRSKRLIRFLRFTAEKALAGSADSLTEYMIGTQVYDRPPTFDPMADGIVRGEAHRLRAKLRDYYKTAGRTDTVLIEYPIGAYLPAFRFRAPEFLPKHGVIAGLMRARDWSQTSLGPVGNWPHILKGILGTHLRSGLPAIILWGPEFRLFFNDAMHQVLGDEYLAELGEPISKRLQDTIPQVMRTVYRAVEDGDSCTIENSRWMVGRGIRSEERYLTASLIPLMEAKGNTAGVLLLAHEVTQRVFQERRARVLMDLSSHLVEASSAAHACRLASSALQSNPWDIPFASLYLFEPDRQTAHLEISIGMRPGLVVSPQVIVLHADDASPLSEAAMSLAPQILQVDDELGPLPLGAWTSPARELVVMPFSAHPESEAAGFLLAGVNPHLALDPDYRTFFELLAARIGTLVLYGRLAERQDREAAFAREREQSPSLTYASEAFRTPVTVLLGLLSTMSEGASLHDVHRPLLAASRRYALRIQKLVKTLIDLENIHQGETSAVFAPTELGTLTSELAGTFRSAIEASNLRMVVNCPPLGESVYVDRVMWEKIVVNLLLNALQHTSTGEIGITLQPVGNRMELVVWDTGTALTEDERSRTERTARNMGLVLVRNLASLLGGRIQVENEDRLGNKFTVSIPRGSSHLPWDRIVSAPGSGMTASSLRPFLEEALTLSTEKRLVENKAGQTTDWHRQEIIPRSSRRILIAIGDSELRHYCEHLLGGSYHIESVSTTEEVIATLQKHPFDILLADAAMDGPLLLRRVRSVPSTNSVSIILLSFRGTGEELRTFAAGADDYLVGPFTTQELLVHVESAIVLAEARKKAEGRERQAREASELQRRVLEAVVDRLPTGVIIAEAASGAITVKNKQVYQMLGDMANGLRSIDDIVDGMAFYADGTPITRDRCPLLRSARFGETVRNETLVYHLASGQHLMALVNSYPVSNREGQHIATVLTLSEVEQPELYKTVRLAG